MDRPQSTEHYRVRAEIIKALAHPSRLMMVEQLSHEPRCVCELREMVGADISTVSKHLTILKRHGIVATEKQGTKVIYRLAMPCVLSFLRCVEAVLSGEGSYDGGVIAGEACVLGDSSVTRG